MKIKFVVLILSLCAAFTSCHSSRPQNFSVEDLRRGDWVAVERLARGTTVNLAMNAGDENRNRFFKTVVAERLKAKYGIALNFVPLNDTAEAIAKLLTEKQAGKTSGGSIDAVWINGENFRAAKNGGLLWGKFADQLPNSRLYDDRARGKDFGTEIENLEAPWLKSQFVFACDAARVPNPPRSFAELEIWMRQNPGKFAYIAPPDFTGSAFLRHVLFEMNGGANKFQNNFDENLYREASRITFDFLNRIKPFLWRAGANYPASANELNRLFANGEIEFAFSYSPNFASEKIRRGEFAPTVKTFLLDQGTIAGYSFLSIPFNAANPAGALVTINYLQSPENLLEQAAATGSLYPHELSKLSAEQRHAVENLLRGAATLSNEELAARAVADADAAYLDRLEKDWREQVLLKP